MTTKTRRWVCPLCGQGVNAPERPRKDDVRRYCLPCSETTGRLVPRTAPALERIRKEARERTAAKTTRKRDTKRAQELAARSIGGFDLMAEAKRIWNLPTMRELRYWRKELPTIEIRRGTNYHTSGHAGYFSRRIVITIGTDPAHALEALAHELMHVAVGEEGHSARFWSRLRSVAKEAWPTANFDFANGPERGWKMDAWIADGIRGTLRKG